QKEVRNKLYELGCHKEQVEELLADMIESGLVNEERYAQAIARGKFHVKHWGKIKIVHRLKAQNISDYCIQQALKQIDPDEYLTVLEKSAEHKWASLKSERNIVARKAKTLRF